MDLMSSNPDVGAVCGRTHPLGSGPMVWYQVFDYAIGHWLLKVKIAIFHIKLFMSEVVYIIRNYSKIIYKSDKRMFNVI